MKRIYLDNNATTIPDPKAVEAVVNCLESAWGNASSLHSHGQEARRLIDRARSQAAALIGAGSESIIFTSGGTEANNLAVEGTVRSTNKRHVITSAIEHQSVMHPCRRLEDQGYEVTYVPVNRDGVLNASDAIAAMRDDTALISIMLANNDTGMIQPVAEIAKTARERGITMHTDAVQAAGRMPINVEELGVDLLTFSSHKISGPKGAGALYIRKGIQVVPVQIGGHQERMIRSGTENVPGIAGFGVACSLASERMESYSIRVRELRDRFERGVLEAVECARLNGLPALRLVNTSNITFNGISAELLAMNLDLAGLAVSTGSACTAGDNEPSHVMLAMGLTVAEALGAIRFSLGTNNTAEEIDRAVGIVCETVRKMRK